MTKRFGNGTTVTVGKESVIKRARAYGIAGDVEALQLGLAAMIGGYDRLLATTPESSHAIITGAFGKSPEVARQILERVGT
jgi:hypothetical protein